jgi:hypothetical protein
MTIHKPKKTDAYRYYWHFAAERQKVFFNRLSGGMLEHFTQDPILQEYKFTNAYRASDRVSQYLIKNVIYKNNDYSNEDTVFRILLFKLFNKIETWEYLERNLDDIRYEDFDFDLYNRLLNDSMDRGNVIYSNAYMMPSAVTFSQKRKHANHLLLLDYMLKDNVTQKIMHASSIEELYRLLLSYPSFGKFLAFQYAIDINYSNLVDFNENDFVVAGPGALDGISKCFANFHDFSSEYIIQYMTEMQDQEFERFNLNFNDLWGRKLHLIDCQNLFCEVSKYTRVALPDIEGVAKRTRIKQKFKPNFTPIEFFYPPKWGINQNIQRINS